MKTKRKFSTGTLGRIDEHADKCRQFVRDHCLSQKVDGRVANEFIYEIQGAGKNFDNKNWARFETMEQLKLELAAWLNPEG